MPLKNSGGHDTDSPISPGAQTVPLVDEGRTTDGLWAEESHELTTGTSRIKRAEMEDLLRRVSREHGDGRDGHALLVKADGSSADGSVAAAPAVTSTLKTPNADAPTTEPSPAAAPNTVRRRWHLLALPILGCLLVAGLLSFIYIRRSRVAGAVQPSSVPVSADEQPALASESPQPQTEPATQGSLPQTEGAARPAPSVREARAVESGAQTEARSAEPAPPATPSAAGPATQPVTAPVLSANERYQRGQQLWESGNRRAALEEFRAAAGGGVADAYYYLGSEYYAEGRDPKSLTDGELKAALNYFLRATSGPHSAQASRSAQLLGREYERRKKQSRP